MSFFKKLFDRRWKKITLITVVVLGAILFCCRVVLFTMRWSDGKAKAIFEKKHAPLQIGDTLVNGHRLHYAISGADSLPTLVFIHGSPGGWIHYSPFMWDSALLRRFRMVSIDRPGFGYSDYGQAMHLQEQSRIILPLLLRLKTSQRMILCGHSLGGPLVAQLAADSPAAFDKIVIVAGALDPAQEKKETWRHIMSHQPLSWFLPGAFRASNTELLYLKEDLKPLAADLAKITTAVSFIHGDDDTWVPIGNVAYGKLKMIHASSITSDTLHGADHLFPWNREAEFKRLLLSVK